MKWIVLAWKTELSLKPFLPRTPLSPQLSRECTVPCSSWGQMIGQSAKAASTKMWAITMCSPKITVVLLKTKVGSSFLQY